MLKLARLTFGHQLVGLIVLVALVCGGVVGLLSVDRARAAVRADVLDKSLGVAEVAANVTQAYLAHASADARQLALNPVIRDASASGDFSFADDELDEWEATTRPSSALASSIWMAPPAPRASQLVQWSACVMLVQRTGFRG